MRGSVFIFCLIGMVYLSCTDPQMKAKPAVVEKAKFSEGLREKAATLGKIPTSIEVNFKSGYWHIASGFNVDSIGDFRAYDGTWLQFKDNHEFTWGRLEEDLGSGAWGWNEERAFLTFLSDTSKEFFIGEWKTTNKGDVFVCIGSTPNNPRSTQFKIVRRHNKIVSE